MTPEFILDELRKMHWSKVEWLADDRRRKNFPNSIETKERERDVLAAAAEGFEKLVAKRAELGKAK